MLALDRRQKVTFSHPRNSYDHQRICVGLFGWRVWIGSAFPGDFMDARALRHSISVWHLGGEHRRIAHLGVLVSALAERIVAWTDASTVPWNRLDGWFDHVLDVQPGARSVRARGSSAHGGDLRSDDALRMFARGSSGLESRTRDFQFIIATNCRVFPIQRKLEDVPVRDDRAVRGKSCMTRDLHDPRRKTSRTEH